MTKQEEWLRAYLKKFFIITTDLCFVLLSLPMALYLRVDWLDFPYFHGLLFPSYYVLSLLSYCVSFWLFRTHRVILHLANVLTAVRLTASACVGAALFYVLSTFVFHFSQVPRSLFLIQILLFVPTSCFFKFYFRILEGFSHKFFRTGVPTLVYGAGANTSRLLPALLAARSEFKIFGILDDSVFKKGSDVQGVKVLGSEKDLPRLIKQYNIRQIVVSMPSAPGERIRHLVRQMVHLNLKVKIMPSPELSLVDPYSDHMTLRDIKIEDLLKRAPRSIDRDRIQKYLEGKTILITGAGGSIGSELTRQIALANPKHLILNDASEHALYQIQEEMLLKYPHLNITAHLANMADGVSCGHLFEKYAIGVVFHACAYKHVPMVEGNVCSAFLNNIQSAFQIFSFSAKYQIEKVVLISSDKAVRPTNVMGATKRLCELMMLWFVQHGQTTTQFSSVRFGNVLGSNGSVVPKFVEQIRAGGPVTVTDPRMTRYFMLIPEAVSLVLQAATSSLSGEIFILNMGEPIKILDMAKDMIQLMNQDSNRHIPIEFTGLRPGEKLYEELHLECEHLQSVTDDYSKISHMIPIQKSLLEDVETMSAMAKAGGDLVLKSALFAQIAEYENQPTKYDDSPSKSIFGAHAAQQQL